jgi:DNA polymerase-3 subunit alpha
MTMNHPIMGFEHLHSHSDFSLLDGFAMVSEYAERKKEINQKYLCITDHGVMGAVPQQVSESEKHNLFPLFGCELYVNHMQPEVENREQSAEYRKSLGDGSTEDRTTSDKKPSIMQKKFDKSCHLLAVAYNNVGYSNLVRLTSWAWIHGYYRRPRVNHDVLQKYKEGIIFTSSCGNSEIANAFMGGRDENKKPIFDEDAGLQMLEKYMAMFGDNFYLELMMLDWKMQKPYDQFLIKAHDKYHIPLIITQDCHYCKQEHSHNQRLMLMQQNKRTLGEIEAMIDAGDAEDLFELQDTNLWLKSEDELNVKWELDYKDIIPYELYKQSKANTVKLCEYAKGVEIDRQIKLPKMPDAEELLMEDIKKGFIARHCPKTPEYSKRIKEEYELICEKGFASYFLIQKMMTDEARIKGPELLGFGDGSEAVGPGRGSACGSLVAYCLRLHDVEPIIHDLRFSRFLSPARGGKQMRVRHTLEPVPHEVVQM